ncbi:MAG: hypothetical protein ABH878_01865, partial [bacterium]
MLWNRRRLLILWLSHLTVFMHFVSSSGRAQTDALISPWRIESSGSLEIHENLYGTDLATLYSALLELPGMTPLLAEQILLYCEEHGLPEVFSSADIHDPEIQKQILGFINDWADSSDGHTNTILKAQLSEPLLENVQGSPLGFGSKITVSNGDRIAMGFAFEKDAGEERFWDHHAVSLQFALPDNWGKCVVGDYRVGFAHGLVVRTTHNYGLRSDPIGNLRQYPNGLREFNSWNETVALRGLGIHLERKSLSLTVWASQRQRDAHLDSTGSITSLGESGLHRTASEVALHANCTEKAWGMHTGVANAANTLHAGVTISAVNWDHPYKYSGESTRETHAGSLDFGWHREPFEGLAEIALDQRQ